MTEIESFIDLYRERINQYSKQINKQFKSIVEFKKCTTKIVMMESGTKIDFNEKLNEITLFIGYSEVFLMCETHQLDIFDAFYKVVTHEYMHVLFGHFDYSELDSIISFVRGESSYPYDFEESPLFIPSGKNKISHKLDGKILNIAGDFEINYNLNIHSPFLRAQDFGLPEGLNTMSYYAIIYHVLNSSNYILYYYSNSKERIKKEYDSSDNCDVVYSNCKNFEFDYYARREKVNEFKRENRFSNLQSKVGTYFEKFNISKTGIWAEFKEISNQIINNEQSMKLSLVDKQENWMKYNNRKEGMGFLYPGKSEKLGAFERKFAKSSVLFVDISGSMYRYIEPLFTFCYYILSKINITLVFYNTDIAYIFDKADNIKLEPFIGGGTDFGESYKKYCSSHSNPNNIYILTDAEDSSLNKFKRMKNCKIWKFSDSRIELYGGV